MTVAQLTVKEDLCQRIMDLPIETVEQVSQYLDGLETYEPNEETIRAIEESMNPENLIGPFYTVEALIESLLADDDA
jgi:hypothetical protein